MLLEYLVHVSFGHLKVLYDISLIMSNISTINS